MNSTTAGAKATATANAGILRYHPSQQAGRGLRLCAQNDKLGFDDGLGF
jgi:hypothetical protein